MRVVRGVVVTVVVLAVLAGAGFVLWSLRPTDTTPDATSSSTVPAAETLVPPLPPPAASDPAKPSDDAAQVSQTAGISLDPVDPLTPATLPPEVTVPSDGPELDAVEAVEVVDATSTVEAVAEVQQRLNQVAAAGLRVDGIYGPATEAAVRAVQVANDLPDTGTVDARTRWVMWSLPVLSSGPPSTAPMPDSCVAFVVGDSLMAWAQDMHTAAFANAGCQSVVDGEGGRSLAFGWQCRVTRADGSRPLLLLEAAEPGNDTCAPSGLQLVSEWSGTGRLQGVLVVALGTNDSGLWGQDRWVANWMKALEFNGGRPVVFVTAAARPGSDQVGRQARYSDALRAWCPTAPGCVLADWAATVQAGDPSLYNDSVHLNTAGTEQRALFMAQAAAAVFAPTPPTPPAP